MGNEELNTIPEKESDEFIKSSVEDLVLILSESKDTSRSESVCILPSCDDSSPIDIPEEKSVTFSNPLFNLNDDFISSDDESLSDKNVSEDNVKIYPNPLFEFDNEYISSDVNPLFDEDECFDSRGDVDEINDFEDGYYDSKGDILYLESLLSDDTTPNLPPEELFKDMKSMFEEYCQREQAAKLKYYSLNEINSQIHLSILVTTSPPVLPTEDLEDSLIMGNKELNTIPEKKSDEFIKSSVEDLVLILSESEDTSRSESVCLLPSDDESLSDKNVSEDNVKIYPNPLFEFDNEYISSDVNPLFDEVLEDIECKDFYDPNLDESTFLVTHLSDANEDECFDSRGDVDEINDFEDGYYDSEGDILYLESLLSDDTTPNLPHEKIVGIKRLLSAVEVTAAGYGFYCWDNVLAEYTKKLETSDKERDELKLTLEKLQNSSKSLNTLLDSQNRLDKGYHVVPLPLTGNYIPPKRNLRLIDKHFESEYVDVSTVSSSDVKIVKTDDHKGVSSTEEPKPVSTTKGKVVVNAVKGSGFNSVKASAFSNGLGLKKSLTPHLKIGTSSRRSLDKDDASKQGRNLKQRSIFEERDFDVQSMMDANYELAARLRAEEKRRKPLTKA
nr:hypothetical protein [Tanacetum cinerariifolium]